MRVVSDDEVSSYQFISLRSLSGLVLSKFIGLSPFFTRRALNFELAFSAFLPTTTQGRSLSINSQHSAAASPLCDTWPRQPSVRAFGKVTRIASISLVGYWLLIFFGTHLPATQMPGVALSDKLCHAAAFAGLSFLLSWALPCGANRMGHVLLAGVIAVAYGCMDELTQLLIPGRSCDVMDLAADCVGVFIGLSCYLVLRQMLSQVAWGRSLLRGLAR